MTSLEALKSLHMQLLSFMPKHLMGLEKLIS